MKKTRWIILISIIVLLLIWAGIILKKYMRVIGEFWREPVHEEYDTWKEKCEYVNIYYECWHYDCSKKGYYDNYHLCRWDYPLNL